jgi:hypothetical protein
MSSAQSSHQEANRVVIHLHNVGPSRGRSSYRRPRRQPLRAEVGKQRAQLPTPFGGAKSRDLLIRSQ